MVVGVFDSGVGGLSVTNAIKAAFPNHSVMYREDTKNVPYGTKSKEQLRSLVLPIIHDMSADCDVIVIACNTVSTVLIDDIHKITSIPIITVEPMIKEASQTTESSIIAVCATPSTLGSQRYASLIIKYAHHLTVMEPDCSTWSSMIESDQVNQTHIKETIVDVCRRGADVIVLGCTHYHWIEETIQEVAGPNVAILQPEPMIISQLRPMLSRPD